MTEPNAPQLRLGTRKVYECGKSNVVINIPKVWRDSVGLNIGDTVFFEIHPDGLMIRPTSSKPKF